MYFTRIGKDKERYYCSIVKLCSCLISNISFRADKMLKILNEAEIDSPYLKKNVSEYMSYLKGGQLKLSANRLTTAELNQINEFFGRLGRSDGQTQLAELKKFEGEFAQKYVEIKEKNDKQGNMYAKLGLLSGLLIGILLV
ncbi:MAG: hypothetical protein IKC35_04480 [Clostridia bacterium]|nr:hypothetical protein [Clostridia bacterium]